MKNFISIPKPCHENWDDMTPQEQGRHCSKCNIVVQDFTAMSNEEILEYLNKNTKHVCARVEESQVYQTPNITNKLKRFLYALAMAFLPMISLTTLSTLVSTEVHAQTSTGGIQGKIIDEKGQPIPFASIGAFQGDTLRGQTKSDFNGNYKIKPLKVGTYSIKIRSVGKSSMQIIKLKIRSGQNTTENVTMLSKKSSKKIIVGMICYPRRIDPMNPGKQEITGDEIRNISGGHR